MGAQEPLGKAYLSHEDGPWVPPSVYTGGSPRAGRWEVQGGTFLFREGVLCHDGLLQEVMRSLSLGICKKGFIAIDGDCKGGTSLRRLE